MSKFILFATVALGAAVVAIPATAQSDNAAAVIRADNSCGGFVPTPSGGFGTFLVGELHSVVTSSGNTSLVCKFDIPEGARPATATHAEGFGCGTFLGGTTDSKMVASPGGQATLTCRINGAT